jgi:outer membrane protein TolC
MRTHFFYLILFLVGLTSILPAQTSLDLTQCLARAYAHSYLLRGADVARHSAEAQLAATQAQRLPAINLSSIYTRIGKISSFSIPMGTTVRTFQFGTPNRVNLDVKLQMPLFTWGRVAATIGLSQSGATLATLQVRQEKLRTTDQVLRGFFIVLFNQELVQLNQANLARAEKFKQITSSRFAAGMVPKLENLRAQVQLENSRGTLAEALDNLQKSKIWLAKLIGLAADSFQVTGSFEFDPITVDPDEFEKRALAVRSELRVFQLQQQLGEHQIDLAQSGNKPNLFFFSGYSVTNGFDPMEPNRFVDNWNVGVQATVPLFDGFKTRHEVQKARLDLAAIDWQRQELAEIIQMQVRQSLVSLKQAGEKIQTQESNITLAREALQIAENQYSRGFASSLDVLNAQQTLAQSEFFHAQAIFNHLMARLDLCKAVEDYTWFEGRMK